MYILLKKKHNFLCIRNGCVCSLSSHTLSRLGGEFPAWEAGGVGDGVDIAIRATGMHFPSPCSSQATLVMSPDSAQHLYVAFMLSFKTTLIST